MSSTWYPPGWQIDVPNPGYGEIGLYADPHPFTGDPLVTEDWSAELLDAQIGQWLTALTSRAFQADDAPLTTGGPLPAFISPVAARSMLPAFQQAVVLAVAGTDRADRIFDDGSESPARPLCVTCNEGTYFSPGALASPWCTQHGHTPFGTRAGTRWDAAQESHRWRSERWERRRRWAEEDRRIAENYARSGGEA